MKTFFRDYKNFVLLSLIPCLGLFPPDSGIEAKVYIVSLLLALIAVVARSISKDVIHHGLPVALFLLIVFELLGIPREETVYLRGWAVDWQILIYGLLLWAYFDSHRVRPEGFTTALIKFIHLAIALAFARLIFEWWEGVGGFSEGRGRYRLTTFLGPSAGSIYYLALFIPALAHTKFQKKWSDTVFMVLIFAMILASGTRISILAVVAILALNFFLNEDQRSRRISGLLLATAIFYGICYSGVEITWPKGIETVSKEVYHTTISQLSHTQFDIIKNGREEAWPLLFHKAMERPLLGRGMGATNRFLKASGPPGFEQIHNDYLKIFFNLGLVGLTLFLTCIAMLLRFLLNRSSSSVPLESLRLSSIYYLVGLLVTMITDNTLAYHFYLLPASITVVYFLSIETIDSRTALASIPVHPVFFGKEGGL